MDPVQIDWDTADVDPVEEGFRLRVHFHDQAPHYWWSAFGAALQASSREEAMGWHSIRALGDPPEGLEVNGIGDGAVAALRGFLEKKVAQANSEAIRAEEGRLALNRRREERQDETRQTAERLTESFRSGS